MSSSPDYDGYSDVGSNGSDCTDYSFEFEGLDDAWILKDDGPLPVANNKTEDSRTDFIDSTSSHIKGAQESKCDEAVEAIVSLSATFIASFSALPQELKDHILAYAMSLKNTGQGILVTASPLINSAEHRKQWRGDDCPGSSILCPEAEHLNVTFEPAERKFWTCRWAGYVMFKEIVKAWYRCNTFILSDLELLSHIAIADCWGLEITPKHHLRKVEFSIHEDDLALHESTMGYAQPSHRLRQLRTDLYLLHNLCEKTEITMHVSSQTFSEDSVPVWEMDRHDGVLGLVDKMDIGIFEKLRELKVDGYQVTVVIDRDCVITPEKEIKHGVWVFLMLDMRGEPRERVDDVSED